MTDRTLEPTDRRLSWQVRLLLGGYPPWWRLRYDDEMRETVLAMKSTGHWRSRDGRDLVRGLVEAWLNPGLVPSDDPTQDPTRRLIPLTAWGLLLFVLAGGGFAKIIDDPVYAEATSAHSAIGWCVDVLMVAAGATALVMAAAALLHLAAILDLGWERARPLVKPLVTVPVSVAGWIVAVVVLQQVAGAGGFPRSGQVIAFSILALVTVVGGVCSTVAIMHVAARVPETRVVRATRRLAMIAVGGLTANGVAAVVAWSVVVASQAPDLLHSDNGMLATPTLPSLLVSLVGLAGAALLCGRSGISALRAP